MQTKKIKIISSSVREGRKSDRVALYFQKYLKEHHQISAEIIDLKEYDFPIFSERLKNLQNAPAKTREFAEKISSAEGLIIVTPEYNGGYPASLKNVIDLLYDEWRKKPILISTVSSGPFGGSQVLTALQFALWKIGALTVPAMFPVASVEKTFTPAGEPADKETDKRAQKFIGELLYWMEARALKEGQ